MAGVVIVNGARKGTCVEGQGHNAARGLPDVGSTGAGKAKAHTGQGVREREWPGTGIAPRTISHMTMRPEAIGSSQCSVMYDGTTSRVSWNSAYSGSQHDAGYCPALMDSTNGTIMVT
jgi:hypothetical protein